MKGKKKKGFTLIELIIVVAIIGILAAIAVPKFGDIQRNSKIKADIATAKVIADALTAEVAQGNLTDGTVTTFAGYLQQTEEPKTQAISGTFTANITNGNVVVSAKAKSGETLKDGQLYPQPVANYGK